MSLRLTAPRRVGTLCMFIIDEFQVLDPSTDGIANPSESPGKDARVGGSPYFVVGARLWLPPWELSAVIDAGPTFPQQIRQTLDTYCQSAQFESRPPPENSTDLPWRYRPRTDGYDATRALNVRTAGSQQIEYQYRTPRIRLTPRDELHKVPLPDQGRGPATFLPTFLHFICSPERANQICDEVEQLLRDGTAQNDLRPALVWEPLPESAKADNLDECVRVMQRIDVFSPNHDEAASFLGITSEKVNVTSDSSNSANEKEQVRNAIADLLAARFQDLSTPSTSTSTVPFERKRRLGAQGPIVFIRSGALGSIAAHRTAGAQWVDAYHTPKEARAGAIRDTTGAGNACLGGFTAALSVRERDVVEALASSTDDEPARARALELLGRCAACGSVSASFVIEQPGLPTMTLGEGGTSEHWNGCTALNRLQRVLPV